MQYRQNVVSCPTYMVDPAASLKWGLRFNNPGAPPNGVDMKYVYESPKQSRLNEPIYKCGIQPFKAFFSRGHFTNFTRQK